MENIKHDPAAALKLRDIRLFIGYVSFSSFAFRALAVIIGFQIYGITHSAFSLGVLGLIEAIPAIAIAPFGGYVADHFDRKKILLVTRAVSCVSAAALALFSISKPPLLGLYSMVFLVGVARGFADPTNTAFEAQIVPKELTVNAASWISSAWISFSVLGPAVMGFVFDAWGAAVSYTVMLAAFVLSWITIAMTRPRPQEMPEEREPIFKSIAAGWRYITARQPLWGSMSLDMFAVFFGGAIALLPIYANDILRVGAKGLGILNAAPSLGAFLTMVMATRKPQIKRPGRNLILCVAGFGVSIIVFAFSRNFALSLVALFFSGAFDGISVVIRRSIIRLLSPGDMRGRIASVSSVFITASNELGAFESGMLASLIGTVPCVAVGGVVTLAITGTAGAFMKELRSLSFDQKTLEKSS